MTLIGWFITISSAVSLISVPMAYVIHDFQRALEQAGWGITEAAVWGTLASLIGVASGVAILKGLDWGRKLYLAYVPLSLLLLSLLKDFDPLWLSSVPAYIVIFVLLTRPAANEFFASDAAPRPKLIQGRVTAPVAVRRVASVILLAIGVLFLQFSFVMSVLFLSMGVPDLVTLSLLAIPLVIAAALMAAGVGLWGWARWRIVLGVVLTVGGGLSALTAALIPLAMMSPEWQTVEVPDEGVVRLLILVYALTGLVLAGTGVPLIITQKRRDRTMPQPGA